MVKGTLDDQRISLNDIFAGSFPFVLIMLLVLILVVLFPPITLTYAWLLKLGLPGSGYDRLITSLTGRELPDRDGVEGIWTRETAGRVCRWTAQELFRSCLCTSEGAAGLAYALAWLRVAGGNSVLPPWVRYRYPDLPPLLDRMRSSPCRDVQCAYCRKQQDLEGALFKHFGFSSFLPVKDEDPPLQKEIVASLLARESCLAVLPTGGGKSLCYQLPGLIRAEQRNALTIIISPLQSLMKDQVDGLKRRGLANVGTVNGLLTMLERSQVLESIRLGDIDLVWISPEQMRNTGVKRILKQREIELVVIDEAHCFSKWGHDFRPDYLFISRFLKELVPEETGHRPLLMAVGDDDQNIYAWDGANVRFIRRFARDYQSRTISLTRNYRSRPGIIRAANTLIATNRDRMKTDAPIRPVVPENPRHEPVTLIRCPDRSRLFKTALTTARETLADHPELSPGDICILSRTNQDIAPLQVLARQMGLRTRAVRSRGFGLPRTREFQILLDLLGHCPQQTISGPNLEQLIASLIEDSGFHQDNTWIQHFRHTLSHYLAETSGRRLPVRHFLNFVSDFSRETRQSWLMARDSLPLSTMHGVKGLEFPVVILAGQPSPHASLEEERRLYYVALTRARERIICLDREDAWNPFLEELCRDGRLSIRRGDPELSPEEARACQTELWELGLADLVISFPAYPQVIHQAQASLQAMQPGESKDLALLEQGEQLFITFQAKPIARFSARGRQAYQQKMAAGLRVERVLFLAAIFRQRQEGSGEKGLEAAESWYTGLFQLLLTSTPRGY